jgi:hypothetical protein
VIYAFIQSQKRPQLLSLRQLRVSAQVTMSFSRLPNHLAQQPGAMPPGVLSQPARHLMRRPRTMRRASKLLAGAMLLVAMLTVAAASGRADRSAIALFSPVLWTGWWTHLP